MPAFLIILLSPMTMPAQSEIVTHADLLSENGAVEQAIQLLENNLPHTADARERADYLVSLSHCYFDLGVTRERRGERRESLLEIFATGEKYADEAISIDPQDYRAYFWRGSNRGKWGQVKGLFSALDRVEDMRDDFKKTVELNPGFSLAWFSLGQLYEKVPGGIISFGNDDYAVSLGRKSIDVLNSELENRERNSIRYDYYIELARQLYVRNWNHRKRVQTLEHKRQAYRSHTELLEKNFYYESTKELETLSDREESKKILLWVIDKLEGQSDLDEDRLRDLDLARKTYRRYY